jgi:uncharacterized protein YcaQ
MPLPIHCKISGARVSILVKKKGKVGDGIVGYHPFETTLPKKTKKPKQRLIRRKDFGKQYDPTPKDFGKQYDPLDDDWQPDVNESFTRFFLLSLKRRY